MKRTRSLFFAMAATVIATTFATMSRAQDMSLNLMPAPVTSQRGTGQLVIDPSFSVGIDGSRDEHLQNSVARFLDELRRQTGMLPLDMRVVVDPNQATLVINCEHASQ